MDPIQTLSLDDRLFLAAAIVAVAAANLRSAAAAVAGTRVAPVIEEIADSLDQLRHQFEGRAKR